MYYLSCLRKEILGMTIHHSWGRGSCGYAEERPIRSLLRVRSYIQVSDWIDWLAVRRFLVLEMSLVLLGEIIPC